MRKLVVIDTETGGFDPSKHSILSLGAVIWNQGGIEEKLSLLINEGDIVAEDQALRVNGLTVEKVQAEGVSLLSAMGAIENMLLRHDIYKKRVTLAGHNVAFDAGFLQRLYRLAGQEAKYKTLFSHRMVCTQTLAISLELAGRVKWQSTGLNALTDHFGIAIREGGAKGKHDSLEDAVATAELLNKLLLFIRDPRQVVPLTQVKMPGIVETTERTEESSDGQA
jgi:DNA polymerase III epsilon subunit-like protein